MTRGTYILRLLTSAAALVSAFSLAAADPTLDLETLKAIPDLPIKAEDIIGLVATAETRHHSTLTAEAGSYKIRLPKNPKEAEKYKEKYAKKSIMPINICMEIYEKKEKAEKRERLMKGSGIILILDLANKKVVEKKKMDLAKLCPS